jgi:hypothetical protein
MRVVRALWKLDDDQLQQTVDEPAVFAQANPP